AAYGGNIVNAPFDIFSDMLRGMRGTMVDMFQRPDKLLEAMNNIFPMLLEQGVSDAKRTGNSRVFMPLHRGADGFMSSKQFETFYWFGLKKIFLALKDEGLTPCPFFEGNYDSRLEYLTELPKGKIAGIFDTTDIFKAKEILGDTMCILGNMPVSLLKTGTPQQVKAYSKKLIEVVGKGGGFIMSSRGVLDDANLEPVKIWGDYTREYGVYS
ncbi:MAG: uroporphyrinogen decarboxylase family protein, partial [Desulfatiglandales bacterium]|nr:uroporphyrinogen decarboxylase family protein [Desulfatiglandales bacterium]